ncbi:MAG TPA: LptF/LptG family permease [bacterium]|nr:LptF/LptG family permease [bacterium]
MTLLDRLLVIEVGSSFGYALGLFSVLLVMNHLFYLARLIIGQGIAIRVALVLMAYKIPYFIAFSAPMGVLLATVWGMGRLADHNELAALRVSGVSLRRIAVPIVAAGVVVAAGVLVFNEGVVSLSEDQYRAVMGDVMAHGPELHPIENVFFQAPIPQGNALYSAHRYDPRSRTLETVTVVYLTPRQPLEVIDADRAIYQQGTQWTFRTGHVYVLSAGQMVSTTFDTLQVTVPRAPQDFVLPPKQPSDMSLRELAREIARYRRSGTSVRPFVGELNTKVATAVSCVAFALLAVPLSLRPHRSGPSMGFGMSIGILVGYYLVAIPAQLAADGHALSPILAAWLPDLLVGAAGAILLARAAH